MTLVSKSGKRPEQNIEGVKSKIQKISKERLSYMDYDDYCFDFHENSYSIR
jgi:hypothetical protein